MNNSQLLVHFIEKYCPFLEVVGQAYTRKEAVALINEKAPQLLFLDIILDVGTAFDLFEELSHDTFKIIFVTAFNQFAIKAFKCNAVDYILKPVEIEDLIIAVNSAIEDIEKESFTNKQQIDSLSNTIDNNDLKYDFIAIPSVERIDFVKLRDIVYLESEGRYTVIYLIDERQIVACKNIGEYEKLLDENLFFRIHHSYIVNLLHVVNINKAAGNYCELKNGKPLPVAKRRQEKLFRFLNIK